MTDLKANPLIILDFGSQYTQLIARRVREMGVYCEIHSYLLSENDFKRLNPCGIILSGGPSTVTHVANPRAPEWVFSAGLPVLGICYGMQTMAVQLGGIVQTSDIREFGYAELRLNGQPNELFTHLEDRRSETGQSLLDVWMSHGDKVTQMPLGFEVICTTNNAPIAGMADISRHFYGLQFHPEVTHTPQGLNILRRFVINICRAESAWTPEHIIQESIAKIKKEVGSAKVLLGLSGGVDSSVVAALLHQAIGDQLVCVFVDTGLLRLHEAEQVQAMFGEHLGIHLITVNAADKFFQALKGISCPEEKRKTIGRLFIEVFDEEAQKIKEVTWLAQGTIYPDVIESAATTTNGASVVIKSHHNVGGLPETLNLKLLEPIRELFKDEVRKVGLELGLPAAMNHRSR
ncbi:MAG: glutamine-hydrolyzing GMP synthase, partial [Legionella sp.]